MWGVTVPSGILLEISVDGLVVLVVFFGLGLLMIYNGFREYQVGRLIRDTATETVNAAAVGRTELVGTAKSAGMTFAQPFADGEALYVDYQIQEEREDSDGDTSWTTIDHDTWVTPFLLDDGTGSIRVEPEVSAKFEISEKYTTSLDVSEGGSAPGAVQEFLEQGTDVDLISQNRRRYRQSVIPPGESVYVLGGAEVRTEGEGRDEDNLVIRRDGGSERFVISDMTEEKLTTTLSRRAPVQIALGLGLSAFSLFLLLKELGL